MNYGVTFPMMGKVDVNGENAHAGLEVAHRRGAGHPRHQDDQVELHQVPGRQGRQGDQALRAERFAGIARGDIEAALATSRRAAPAGRLAARRSAAHVRARRAVRGRPDPEPERGFPEGSAAGQDQPVDRHLLRRRRPHPGARLGAPRRAAGASRATRPKPYLPIEGAANFRAAVQALLFGAGHEAIASRPRRDDPVGRLERRPQGRRRLHRPLAAGQRGLGQRPELGEPPLDVRRRRARRPRLPVLRRARPAASPSTRCARRCAACRRRASSCCTRAATTRPAST